MVVVVFATIVATPYTLNRNTRRSSPTMVGAAKDEVVSG
jgi:hypothetical protein